MSYNPLLPAGQATMANSSPVVIASNQSAIPISGTIAVTSGSLATSAKQDAELAELVLILAKLSADPATQTTLAAILAKIIAAPSTEAKQDAANALLTTISGKDFATQTTLAAILAKIIASPATAANQVTEIASLASIDTKLTNPLPISGTVVTGGLTDTQLRATPVPVSGSLTTTPSGTQDVDIVANSVGLATAVLQTQPGVDIGDVTINNASGGAAVNIQDGGNSITVDNANLDTALSTLNTSINTLLKPANTLAAITAITNVVHVDDNAGSLTVDGTFWQATQPISAIALPLPTGAATSANQTTELVSLASIDAKLTSPIVVDTGLTPGLTDAELRATPVPISGTIDIAAGSAVIGHIIADTGSTTAVTGNVTIVQGTGTNLHTVIDSGSIIANAGTNLNTSLLALEAGGNLAAIKADVDNIPPQGQAIMASSMPVVIASDQSAIPISGTVTVDTSLLATAAKQDSQTTLLTNIDGGIPAALGQTTMSASMPVTIASDQSQLVVSVGAIDNTTVYSDTLSATGAVTGFLTTGYQSTVIQISGNWVGNMWMEGSNDNTNWGELLLMSLDEFTMQDLITENGIYVLKATTKYVRLNVLQLQQGSITVLIVGRTAPGINATDRLSFALDRSNNMPLYITEIETKKDTTNALIPSDAAVLYDLSQKVGIAGDVGAPIDTTGYQSISVQIINGGSGGVLSFWVSHNLTTWLQVTGVTPAGIGVTTATATTGFCMFPAMGKYFKVQTNATSLARALVYLRQTPFPFTNSNLSFINGVAPTTSGVSSTGVLAVGGQAATGLSAITNPIVIAGADGNSTALIRRLLTDTSGRLQTAFVDQTQSILGRAQGGLSPAASSQNVAQLAVTDLSQFEGQSFIELLGQMLLEMRITNQYLSELPKTLQGENGFLDEPAQFRNEQSIFAT